ncbi:MAG TPA: hypothetical protein VMG36_08485 [Thermoplasmata archaeon]|nr:hypothetical protein [Thermoplasmata archaeon]
MRGGCRVGLVVGCAVVMLLSGVGFAVGAVPAGSVHLAGGSLPALGGATVPLGPAPGRPAAPVATDGGPPAPTVALLAGYNGSVGSTDAVTVTFNVISNDTEVVVIWAIGGQSSASLPGGLTVVASYDTAVCCGSAGVAVGLVPAGFYGASFFDSTGTTTAFSVAVYGISNGASYGYSGGAANESQSLGLGAGGAIYLGAEGTGGYYGANNSSLTTIDEESPGLVNGITEKIGRQSSPEFNFTTIGVSYGIVGVGVFTQEYPLQFTESGLPANTTWGVNLSNGASNGSNGTSLTVDVPNGTFSYFPYAAAYATVPLAGSITVDGAGATVALAFQPTYPVTFSETGLFAHTAWSVGLNGTVRSGANGSSIPFALPNGTYPFVVEPVTDEVASPASGNVTVAGGAVGVSVVFRQAPGLYELSVSEQGLPTGTTWGFLLGIPSLSEFGYSSDQSTVTILARNGTYGFEVFPVYWFGFNTSIVYYPHPQNGTVVVAGADANVSIRFAPPPAYTVEFVAQGLAAGAVWWLNLSTGADFRSTSASIAVNLTNGSYSYAVGLSLVRGVDYTAPAGAVTVNGGRQTVTLPFGVAHAVTFAEKGLPTGGAWFVTIADQPTLTTTNATLRVFETAGVYAFTVGSVNASYRPTVATGLVAVHHGAVTKHVKFVLVTFPLVFTETGLPTHTKWCLVGLPGRERCTSGTSIAYVEPNGTYAYQPVTNRLGYTARGGTLLVNGSAVAVAVDFTAFEYSITFDFPTFVGMEGVVSDSWGVDIGSQLQSTNNATSLVLYEPDGTYSYTLVLNSHGTLILTGHGRVTVSGANVVVQVTDSSF